MWDVVVNGQPLRLWLLPHRSEKVDSPSPAELEPQAIKKKDKMSLYIQMAQRNAARIGEASAANRQKDAEYRRRRMQEWRVSADPTALNYLPQPPLQVDTAVACAPQEAAPAPAALQAAAMSTLCGSIAASRRVFRRPRTAAEKERAKKDKFSTRVKVSSTLIGSGAFGAVYLAVNEDSGQWIAVKRLPIRQAVKNQTVPGDAAGRQALDSQLDELVEEIRVMRDLDHPNIVRYLHADRNEQELSIFMEYMSGGSVGSLLKKFEVFSESMVKVYMRQALSGVAYLHSKNIVHRDIKADNILLHSDGTAKLSDFGTSREFSESANLLTVTGTPWFMAPEVVKGVGHGAPADIWSIGCTIIHLSRGMPPFDEYQSPVTAMYNIALHPEKVFEYVPASASASLRSVLACCLCEQPEKRWTAAQLLGHEFFASTCSAKHGNQSSDDMTEDEEATTAHGGQASDAAPAHVVQRPLTPRSHLALKLRTETQNQQSMSQAAFGSRSILEGQPP
jgi:serine/threonine protein kinase